MYYNIVNVTKLVTFLSFSIAILCSSISKDKKGEYLGEVKRKDSVEKILKGSLDSIPSPSPSVKILIMGGKVCLRCKGKKSQGLSTNF